MQTVLILAAVLCVGALAQFTSEGQDAILNVHNTLRSKIANGEYVAKGTSKPAASDMLKMKWDTTIAASAQAYADQCPTEYSRTSGLGENLHLYWTSENVTNFDEDGASASASWEQEFQDFGWASNLMDMDLYNTGIAHATQMAWAKTNLIGCGVKDCGMDTNGYNKVTVVCQYTPQGNYLNQTIYTTGATCSACPSGTSCESATGLCV